MTVANVLLHKTQGLWRWANLGTALFGAAYVWHVGHKGVCLYDQSGIFDGAWRILQGQVPYRDFYLPYGPVAFFIQSLFFRVTGVDFSSMVLSAAVVNGLAVLLVIRLLRNFFPELMHAPMVLGAGLLTAVWFQAPYGTLWFEQLAFLFNVAAVVLLLEAGGRRERVGIYMRCLAGCLLVLAVLTKQSAGVVLMVVPLGVAVIAGLPNRRKAALGLSQVVAGMGLTAALFVAWLLVFSSAEGFWQSVIVMSRTLAGTRLSLVRSGWDLLMLKPTIAFVWPALLAFSIFAVSRRAFVTTQSLLITWILLGYAFLQNVFASITLQDYYNSLSFLGLINGLALGLLCRVMWTPRPAGRPAAAYWLKGALPVLAAVFLFYIPGRVGYQLTIGRSVQQFEPGTEFVEDLRVPGMSRVHWGNPTPVDQGWTISRKDFEDLNQWLEDANENFFVFTDATILYGLHGKVSPQPWLYFMRDHSFRVADIAAVDETLVKSLRKNKVTIIVIEKMTFGGDHQVLEQMPQLQMWMRNDFAKVQQFGLYEVWALQPHIPF